MIARTVITGTALEFEIRMFDAAGARPVTRLPLDTPSRPFTPVRRLLRAIATDQLLDSVEYVGPTLGHP